MNAVLVGNPNSGKTSLFNRLTGTNQKVGNYPGITVDKREGRFVYGDKKIEVSDLPGIYSLYAGSEDERVAVNALLEYQHHIKPTLICMVDYQTKEKNLLLLSQLMEWGLPLVAVLNIRKKTTDSEVEKTLQHLQQQFDVPWVSLNANTGKGTDKLKALLAAPGELEVQRTNESLVELVRSSLQREANTNQQKIVKDLRERLEYIDGIEKADLGEAKSSAEKSAAKSKRLDNLLMHPLWGYLIFILALLLMFQAVFSWASYPMDWIEYGFTALSEFLSAFMPSNFFTDAITQGIIPGLSGVVVFVPQIAFLFLFIALFEESGYMTRVVYLMDRLVKPFGLSGRSVVPLISGYACAIPAIMATRTIKHPREKLLTMLVIPFMTCSARLPVYATLIALLVSSESTWGPFNSQGLILMAMYFFGALMSFLTALLANAIMKGKGRSLLLMELPNYKIPEPRNIALTVWEKCESFITQAGKVILLVSLALYFLANLGFNDTFNRIKNNDPELVSQYSQEELAKLELEHSLIGQLGKGIEPVIKPLGYDWKIGISLITSFAAREVFVGTMSTIYALEDPGDDTSPITEKMRNDTGPDGQPRYSMAVILSLLVFYALALQCLSTVAVMVKESGGWKWAFIQLGMATGAAYALAFLVYQIFS